MSHYTDDMVEDGMMSEDDPKEVYLGDGLYASFDGFALKLRAPREGGDHEVFLEPDMWGELQRFMTKAARSRSGA